MAERAGARGASQAAAAERRAAGGAGPGASYAGAGVDIAAGDRTVERLAGAVAATARPEVIGGIGGFGGLFSLGPDGSGREQVLVASTDGVGTKTLVARAVGRYDTIGLDLVAMCVDDVVCTGAEPLFLLDYVAVGRLDPERVEQVVSGIAEGCRRAGCALLGGETAEHPDAMASGDLDLAGFAVGRVERQEMLGAHRVGPGDALVGLRSPGLRSNGYSLARKVLLEGAGLSLEDPAWPGADHTLADELLEPSRIYAPAVRSAMAAAPGSLRAAAHITGGGIPGNLARVLPDECDAEVDRRRWEEPRIFGELRRLGGVSDPEMTRVFNLGVGMVLVVDPVEADEVCAALGRSGEEAIVLGEVTPGHGKVSMR